MNPESLFLYISVILFPSHNPATNRKTLVYVKAWKDSKSTLKKKVTASVQKK
jgi:hypothetical protein